MLAASLEATMKNTKNEDITTIDGVKNLTSAENWVHLRT
jgi:hypothetical protein